MLFGCEIQSANIPAAARLHRVAPVLPITAILPPPPHEMKFDEVNPFVWPLQ